MLAGNSGGAGYGLRDWLVQRVSAVYLLAYLLHLLVFFALHQTLNYAAWSAWFSHGWVRLASILFWLCLCLHAWVGMRDVLMDYVRHAGLRLLLESGVVFALAAYMLWAVQILWRV